MKVDNFEILSSFLPEEKIDDKFYFLQILKRRKENPEIKSDTILINSYYISSKKNLLDRKTEIIWMCEHYNARAYLNLNIKDKNDLLIPMIKKLFTYVENKNVSRIHRVFDSACGSSNKNKDKLWIVDIDNCNSSQEDIVYFINTIEPIGIKVIATIPTINGLHLISRPFNTNVFSKKYPNIDVKKNNHTLLYYNKIIEDKD